MYVYIIELVAFSLFFVVFFPCINNIINSRWDLSAHLRDGEHLLKCLDFVPLQNSRSRVRSEREERKIEGDLRKSQRSCEQLDSQKVFLSLYFSVCFIKNICKKKKGTKTQKLHLQKKNVSCSIFVTSTFQGITVPREDWYWPKAENEEEEDCLKDIEEGRDEENEDDFVDLTVCMPFNFSYL